MNNDRIEGSVKQATGGLKAVAGKVLGDAKLESEGKAENIEGVIQNAIGGIRDTVKDALKKAVAPAIVSKPTGAAAIDQSLF